MQAYVTAHSQAYRLRERMAQAKVEHGQGEVYFCTMGPIGVAT